MGQLFGTDGVRGIPGQYPLVPDFVRRLAFVSSTLLRERLHARGLNGKPPVILLGRDSRASGVALGRSLVHGFTKAGCVTVDLGVLPTPALSYLTPRRGAMCGVMISASHNPAEFNGIKFFTSDGFKMPIDVEDEIERRLPMTADPGASASTAAGRLPDDEAVLRYLSFLRSTFPPDRDLAGMRLVVDCANGAAARLAPRLFAGLGAEVFPLGCKPDGSNINRGCGALATEPMRREVVRRRAFCGLSLDGDADRAIFADETGAACDGDVLIGMAAVDLQERGLLKGRAVVLTVMSNFGLIEFLRERGIESVCVPVGDRNVTDTIEKDGLSLGGENSGHIVFRRYSPTGDGLLTALQVLSILARSGRSLSSFRKRYRSYPQLLSNLRVERRVPLERLPRTRAAIRLAQERLKGRGRVLVRYSGTEPLVRILVEGPDRGICKRLSASIADVFQSEVRSTGPEPDEEAHAHATR
ncbi:MAG: phosphoglucosamine mutase [Elusimicrobia bacterium]|nr:phosphoglucosamine mutase [Elusimicrobiota bacterium]